MPEDAPTRRRFGERSRIGYAIQNGIGTIITRVIIFCLPAIGMLCLYAIKLTLDKLDDHVTAVNTSVVTLDGKVEQIRKDLRSANKDIAQDHDAIGDIKVSVGEYGVRLTNLEGHHR